MVCQMYCSPTACYFQFHLATSRWQLRNLRKCSVTWIWRQTASPNIFWKMVPFWLDIMMISILQRFLISKTHPEISVDELIQLSNFRKSWMSASASNFLENDWRCWMSASWDHSPQDGTKMTLDGWPRFDVRWWEVQGVCFSRDICDPELVNFCLRRSLEELLGTIWEDDGLWLVLFFHVLWWLQRLQSWCWFVRFFLDKKVSCTRLICGSPFMIHVGEGWFGLMSRVFTFQKKKYNWQQLVKCAVFDLHRNGKVADFHWEIYFLH